MKRLHSIRYSWLLVLLNFHPGIAQDSTISFREGKGCGLFASSPLSEVEYLGARAALERSLFDQNVSHCEYALELACLDWKTGHPDGGVSGFRMALGFCDEKSIAKRGEVAAALARDDFGEAYAAWSRNVMGESQDSLALKEYEPAVFAGLSISGFAYHGQEKYRLPKGKIDPDLAGKLSIMPGLGFLYIREPKIAASHFILSTLFTTLCGYLAWTGYQAVSRDERMVAYMDFALVFSLFMQRYYLGGMHEAKRLAEMKNREWGQNKVADLWEGMDPFKLP